MLLNLRFCFFRFPVILFWSFFCCCISSLASTGLAGDINEIATRLGSVDLAERRDAAYTLAGMGPQALPALEQLVEALGDKDEQVWFQAITAIGKLGPDASSSANDVAFHLGSDSQQRRYRAAWCLSCLGSDAIPVIEKMLTHESERNRTAAVAALGDMPDCRQEVLPLLNRSVTDQPNVATQAIASLVKLQSSESLITALADDRYQVQVAAARGLATFVRLPSEAEVKLIELCLSSDVQVRAAAISAMSTSSINTESLQTIIQDSLNISDPLITDAIILLLKKRADRSDLIQAVCSGLSSDNAAVRAESAQIIGLTAKDSDYARKALIDTLQISMDDTPSVIQAMTRMGDSMIDQLLDYDDSNEAFEKKLTEVLTSLGGSRINKLLESLQSDRVVASTRAAGALAMMDRIPKEAVSELVNALDSPIENVQLSSLKALHRQEELSFKAIGKIRSFASGNRIEHRVAAIQLLAKVDASSEETLIIFDEAARESNLLLRLAVLEAITGKTFVSDRYVEFLQNCFLEKDKEIRLRAIGVLAQMELCPQQFEKTLFQLVKDDSVQVRFSALKALGVIETKSPMLSARIAAMLPGADTEMLVEILQVLASYQESASEQFGVVKKLLSHPSSEVRAQAAVCLAKINEDSDSVIDAVLPLLKDEDWLVRKTAAKSLAEYGPAAKRAVADLFRLLDSEEDEEAARDALKAIDDVGPEALEVLMNGLDSDDRRIRFYAMYLIGKIGPAAEVAIPKLEAMLQDSDSGRFRETIQQAIDRIQPLDESR